MPNRATVFATLTTLAATLLPGTLAHGLVQAPGSERPLEVAGGVLVRGKTSTATRSPTRKQAGAAALAAAGFARALWDADTDVPTRVWGHGYPVPGAMGSAAIALAAARVAIAQHLATLAPGAAIDDFVVVSNQVTLGVRTVGFRQHHLGLPVIGGQVSVAFKADRLVVISSQALPDVQVTLPTGIRSVVRARTSAASWLTSLVAGGADAGAVGARAILPLVEARSGLGPRITYRVVDPVTVTARTQPGAWQVFVDGDTGAPVARRSTLMFGSGTVFYRVPDRAPTGTFSALPAGQLTHDVNGQAVTADVDGNVSWADVGDAIVGPGFGGPQVRVFTADGPTPSTALTLVDGGTATWDVGASSADIAHLSAAIRGQQAKDFARSHGYHVPSYLDGQLPIYVNEPGACNAFSNGDDIHFFPASADCENTGAMADVVFHEFGHSLHIQGITPGVGQFDGSVSEGIADFLAGQITGDSGMGRGFFFDDQPLRELDPIGRELSWPQDDNADPHLAGLIIGGALWDLRKALIAELGEADAIAITSEILWSIMARSTDLPSTYVDALLTDDDDGDLANGTPHGCAIKTAFGAHGLIDDAQFFRPQTPTIDAAGLTVTVPLAPIADASCLGPDVASGALTWRLRADPATTGSIAMTATDDGTAWTATLPTPAMPGVIEYQVTLQLTNDAAVTYPRNAADPYYQVYAGPLIPVWCASFAGTSDDEPRDWTFTEDFEWGSPSGLARNDDDPATAYAGSTMIGTVLGGAGRYQAQTTSTATTPIIDVRGYHGLRLQLRRWLSVEDSLYDHATIAVDGVAQWANATQGGVLAHVDREWRLQDLDIDAQARDGEVHVAFTLDSDQGLEFGGWNLDDVCIMAVSADPRCGDAAVDDAIGETCDDGNAIDGDGCSAVCLDEAASADDDGGCCQSDRGAPAPTVLGLLTLGMLLRMRRRPRGT